jgi:hypothetical protein
MGGGLKMTLKMGRRFLFSYIGKASMVGDVIEALIIQHLYL